MVKYFNGKINLNTSTSTKIYIDLQISVVDELNLYGVKLDNATIEKLEIQHISIGPEEINSKKVDILTLMNHVQKTLEKDLIFYCMTKVDTIMSENSWFYISYPACKRRITPRKIDFWCIPCEKQIERPIPRCQLELSVIDHSGLTIFLDFDEEAKKLIGQDARMGTKENASAEDVAFDDSKGNEPSIKTSNGKQEPIVENEISAIGLTTGHDDPRPNRRLVDFIFHDEDGKAQPVEILEVTDLFITGVILPLEPSGDPSKDKGVRCEGFGRIETWDISGYEDGEPTIWISTELGDYDCGKPAASYKKIYELLYEKARACIEVYKKLSRSLGGNPDIALDELIVSLVRSMSGSKNFPPGASIKEFIVSRGEFIYNQLIGLDITSNQKDQKFSDLPVLVTLCDECKKSMAYGQETMAPLNLSSGGSLKIGDAEKKIETEKLGSEEDEDAKLARLLQEEEEWKSMNQRKGRRQAGSNKYYIKINEDEIAIDYPLPAYYKPNN
uniref:Uncharacterized protein n=1 Tax=Chenopodium quinoa TaxID=63459 RepID=A0A803KRA4_CHEQI